MSDIEAEHTSCAFWLRALQTLERCRDTFVSVELTGKWRLHLVYASKDGTRLVTLLTQRIASLTTMMTLLVGTQVATLFSPSRPTETSRTALENKEYGTVEFWAGFVLCLGIFSSILTIVALLITWSLFGAVSSNNAKIFMRSSMSLYAVSLPIRMAHFSVSIFILWINLFFFVIMPWEVAMPLSVAGYAFFFHLVTVYSFVGRVLMLSGAIGDERIMDENVEDDMDPMEITVALVEKSLIAKEACIPVSEQYKIKYQEQLEILEEGGSLCLEELRLSEFQFNDPEEDEEKPSENKKDE